MFLVSAIVIIAIISLLLAVWSLKNIQKEFTAKETKEALKKERVIFHSSDTSS